MANLQQGAFGHIRTGTGPAGHGDPMHSSPIPSYTPAAVPPSLQRGRNEQLPPGYTAAPPPQAEHTLRAAPAANYEQGPGAAQYQAPRGAYPSHFVAGPHAHPGGTAPGDIHPAYSYGYGDQEHAPYSAGGNYWAQGGNPVQSHPPNPVPSTRGPFRSDPKSGYPPWSMPSSSDFVHSVPARGFPRPSDSQEGYNSQSGSALSGVRQAGPLYNAATHEDIRRARNAFYNADVRSEGRLDPRQFMEALHYMNVRMNYPEALRLFGSVDRDQDGHISEEEFVDLYCEMRRMNYTPR